MHCIETVTFLKVHQRNPSFEHIALQFDINLQAADGPDTDDAISVAGVQGASISGPVQADAVRDLGLLADWREVGAQVVNDALALQVPDLDAGVGGSAQPVAVGAEAQGVDNVAGIKRVQTLALSEIPQHSNPVLATGGTQGTVGGDSHCVDVAGMTGQVGAELAVSQVPNLNQLVPASGDNDGVVGDGGETHAADPLGVSILLLNGVLALAEGVPQLDGLITRSRHDLTVVHGESDGQDILGVTDEATGGGTSAQVPQTKGTIP
mmetsp:Transcript_28662/g.34818  ORF Transcript_28662/g.34818 Transcript_28662/m.34818 type:complete len:265 (+) Transcript_28662:31-825(+)